MSKFLKLIIFATLLVGMALPQIVDAKGLVPCGGHTEPRCNLCHIFIVLQSVLNGVGLVVAGWAVIFIVIGGIVIMAAGGSPEKVSEGKRMISYAIIGIIIAFTAWMVINMIMNELVNPKAMPWPWNKIECKPTNGNGDEEGEYCVCEIPRYSLKPDKLGTDVRATSFEDEETCEQLCVVGNSGTYCPNSSLITLSSEDYNLYCVDNSTIKTKQVCRLYIGDAAAGAGCRLNTTCYDSDDTCMNDARSTYKNKCYLDDNGLCEGYYKGLSTYCPTGANKDLCENSSSKYVLYKWREEKFYNPTDKPIGSYNAYECSQGAYGNTNYYCRLNCQSGQYDLCHDVVEDWCNEIKENFSCFGSFTCKNMMPRQEGDACDQLKKLLSCMATKLPPQAKIITAISDNSKYKCFDLNYWDEKGKCSGTTDSCTRTCCGHSRSSLHYGGIPGTTDCRKCSWATDFSNASGYFNSSEKFEGFKRVVEDCGEEEFHELGEVNVVHEGNHIHIQLGGISEHSHCGTAGL